MFVAQEEAMTVENKLLKELYDHFYVRPELDEQENEETVIETEDTDEAPGNNDEGTEA